MKKIVILSFVALFVLKAASASPFSENVLSSKSGSPRTLKELQKVLFPTRLDGASGNTGYRIVPKHKQEAKDYFQFFDNSRDFFTPQVMISGPKKDFSSQVSETRLPYNLYLLANSNVLDQPGPGRLQDPNEYGRVLKTSSVGIAYPLTSNFTLDGRYAVVKSDNLESISPFVGGTYRLNAATSISVSYPDIRPEDQNTISASAQQRSHTSAELKIHF